MAFLDNSTPPSALTKRMMEAVLAGAREAVRSRASGLSAQQKSEAEGDIVTQGDQASQAAIFAALPPQAQVKGKQETIGFYGEEAMHTGYKFPAKAHWRWCADPIDGTKPYYSGEPYWSVSLALQHYCPEEDRWESEAGVIYRATAADVPSQLQGRLYWAEKGSGAFVLDVQSGRQQRLGRPEAIAPVVEFEAHPEVSTPE